MFAIANISGHQFHLKPGIKVEIERFTPCEAGESFEIKDIILFSKDGKSCEVNPSNVVVKAKLLAHYRDHKVLVFKKKRRKGYKKKQGHRQEKTLILIEEIVS